VFDAEVQALAYGFRLQRVECDGEALWWWRRRCCEFSPIFVTHSGACLWMSAFLSCAE
jgi:hypothetical protein